MGINIKSLSFIHSNASFKVLNDINLEARSGELLFVIGKNGSGKSTLLSCIAGLVPEFIKGEMNGEVNVCNMTNNTNSKRTPVGMALQDSDTYLFEGVGQELIYPVINSGTSPAEAEQRVFEIAKLLDVVHLLKRAMSTLSGGEKQKISIAAALATNAPVLLLDEPVEQLDPDAAHKVFSVLNQMTRQGKTIIVAARNQDFANLYADSIYCLDNGLLYPAQIDTRLVTNYDNSVAGDVWNDTRSDSCKQAHYASQNQPAVTFDHLTHSFQNGCGIENISLSIERGKVTAIMGPNGAGKSTLIKHCISLLKPQKGYVYVFGENTIGQQAWKLARKVGILFQNPDDQIFNERVDKEVAWNLKVRGMQWHQALAEARIVLSDMQLEHLCDKHPHSLTRSQRQLISLASVLVTGPELIILDEPSKSLDAEGVKRIMSIILRYCKPLGTIVIVCHDPALAWAYSDNMAVLNNGRLIAFGKTKNLLLNIDVMEKAKLARHPFVSKQLNIKQLLSWR